MVRKVQGPRVQGIQEGGKLPLNKVDSEKTKVVAQGIFGTPRGSGSRAAAAIKAFRARKIEVEEALDESIEVSIGEGVIMQVPRPEPPERLRTGMSDSDLSGSVPAEDELPVTDSSGSMVAASDGLDLIENCAYIEARFKDEESVEDEDLGDVWGMLGITDPNIDEDTDVSNVKSTGGEDTGDEAGYMDDADLSEKDRIKAKVAAFKMKSSSHVQKLFEKKWKGANRTLSGLIQDHMRAQYKTGCTELRGTLKQKYNRRMKKGGKERIERAKFLIVEAGISDTRLVEVDGKKSFIVKKVGLSKQIMSTPGVQESIQEIIVDGLSNYGEMLEKVDEFIKIGINKYFQKQVTPYYTGATNEKIAEIIGRGLKVYVPAVEIVKARGDKVYSSHKYAPHKASLSRLHNDLWIQGKLANLNGLDEQSVQDLYILDTLIKNLDRHAGNVLVTEDRKVISIDHALSLQGSKSKYDPTPFAIEKNASITMLPSHACRPLTEASKKKVRDFDLELVIASVLEVHQLVVDPEVLEGLKVRAQRAKQAIQIPGITGHQLMIVANSEEALQALQANPELTPSELLDFVKLPKGKKRPFPKAAS